MALYLFTASSYTRRPLLKFLSKTDSIWKKSGKKAIKFYIENLINVSEGNSCVKVDSHPFAPSDQTLSVACFKMRNLSFKINRYFIVQDEQLVDVQVDKLFNFYKHGEFANLGMEMLAIYKQHVRHR